MKVKISMKELRELALRFPSMTVLHFMNNKEVYVNETNN